jgi:hypothetical protein
MAVGFDGLPPTAAQPATGTISNPAKKTLAVSMDIMVIHKC